MAKDHLRSFKLVLCFISVILLLSIVINFMLTFKITSDNGRVKSQGSLLEITTISGKKSWTSELHSKHHHQGRKASKDTKHRVHHPRIRYHNHNKNSNYQENHNYNAIPEGNSGGIVYTSWGNETCSAAPTTRTIYSGIAASIQSTIYINGGGGLECLEYSSDRASSLRVSQEKRQGPVLSAVKYRLMGINPNEIESWKKYDGTAMLCAVCRNRKFTTVVSHFGRSKCADDKWHKAYEGFAMSASTKKARNIPSSPICVVKNPKLSSIKVDNEFAGQYGFVKLGAPFADTKEAKSQLVKCVVCIK